MKRPDAPFNQRSEVANYRRKKAVGGDEGLRSLSKIRSKALGWNESNTRSREWPERTVRAWLQNPYLGLLSREKLLRALWNRTDLSLRTPERTPNPVLHITGGNRRPSRKMAQAVRAIARHSELKPVSEVIMF